MCVGVRLSQAQKKTGKITLMIAKKESFKLGYILFSSQGDMSFAFTQWVSNLYVARLKE